MVLPKDSLQVKNFLRKIGAPATLFGEKDPERKMRLKQLTEGLTYDELSKLKIQTNHYERSINKNKAAKFYSKCSDKVKNLRIWLTKYSLGQSNRRIARQMKYEDEQIGKSKPYWVNKMTSNISEFADVRPVSCCAFCSDGKSILTAGWSGNLKIWSITECTTTLSFKAHDQRVTGIATNPKSDIAHVYGPAFATGSADQTARIWTNEGKLITTFSEHRDRLGRVAFHPSGCFLATASFDHSWRFWNLERANTILSSTIKPERNLEKIQEGHTIPTYSLAFNCDGSLLGSGGMDGMGRIWDLRTGHNVLTLDGHAKPIIALDFSPDGYQIVTGSMDNSCQLWDLRKAVSKFKVFAHQGLVSHAKYHPNTGKYIVTASHDSQIKIWSTYDFHLYQALNGHENKILGLDVHSSFNLIASVSYDRMLKFWLL